MKYLKIWQAKNSLLNDGIAGKNTLARFRAVYGLSKEQAANILGQVYQETGGFKSAIENLNYSAEGLAVTWETRFTKKSTIVDKNTGKTKTVTAILPIANVLAKNPQAIANYVYSNRMGNGNADSGEGWKYRGRGAIMITGKENYEAFAKYIGRPEIVDNPDLILDYYFETAIFYFKRNNLLSKANTVNDKSITEITKAVNGGYHGLDKRKLYTKNFLKLQK